ncbi:MAG: hypothetical protein WAV11_02370 [Minisyncoccia bacterium]
MPKKVIEDIITSKRSIRRIPISKTRKFYNSLSDENDNYVEEKPLKNKSTRNDSRTERETIDSGYENFVAPKANNGINSRIIIWGLAIFSFLVLIFTIFSSLSVATVKIYPKTTIISLNETFIASQDAVADDLGFETLRLEKELTKTVEATAEENVSAKATGEIIIYNNYSSNSQRLVKNTRFTNKSGNVYRIIDSAIVPGRKKVGSEIIPGSVTAKIIADKTGEEYNAQLSDLSGDLKIPGFLGMPNYDGFYARLKTDITGGYEGLMKKVSIEVQKSAEEELTQKLKTDILSEVYASKPETHIIFDGGYFWEFGPISSSTSAKTNSVEFKQKIIFHGILFNIDKLARFLAKNKISADFSDSVSIIQGSESVKINVDTSKLSVRPWEANTLPLQFIGEIKLVWLYDIDKVRKALVNSNKKDIEAKISPFVKAEKAEVSIRPAIWSGVLPSKAESIIIETIIK